MFDQVGFSALNIDMQQVYPRLVPNQCFKRNHRDSVEHSTR
ncbi:hypothetical protein XFF6166_10216 [Xanthomonas citri pv. fuscans]|nr:hypothetical protein XFF6166_10216 [Xanthomonas citri pv. fuscans]SOO07823.1 hypothetical protein XFF6970_1020095 [Xanthomonas citri pv. fuscans]